MTRAVLLMLAAALVSGCASSPDARPDKPQGFVGRWETIEPSTSPSNVAAGPLSLDLEVREDGTLNGTWKDKDGSVVAGGAATWEAQGANAALVKGEDGDGSLELIDANNLRITGDGQTFPLRRVE